jgi:hypothetical protein
MEIRIFNLIINCLINFLLFGKLSTHSVIFYTLKFKKANNFTNSK